MVDVKNDIKRTYFLPAAIDYKVKIAAVEDQVKQSDIVRLALEEYLAKRAKKK